MTARDQLIRRLLASPQLARANSMKRVLRYLCEHNGPATEYDLAVEALRRSRDFDPRIDPIVRVTMANLRERLEAYFAEEGKFEALRLTIPKGQYRAMFCEPAAESQTVLSRFWRPYLSPEAHNILLYNELLFLRDNKGSFIRNLYVNDPNTAAKDLKRRAPEARFGSLMPSYNFISAGEVHLMFAAIEMFRDFGVRIECRNWRHSSWNELQQANLIVLGSSRTNTFLDSLQGGCDLVITDHAIENRNPLPGEQKLYRGARYREGKLDRVTEYALVTRRPGLTPNSWITSIAANHSRPFEGAVHCLLTERGVQSLFETMNLLDSPLPEQFQVLLRVELVNYDEQLINVEYVTHRVKNGD